MCDTVCDTELYILKQFLFANKGLAKGILSLLILIFSNHNRFFSLSAFLSLLYVSINIFYSKKWIYVWFGSKWKIIVIP